MEARKLRFQIEFCDVVAGYSTILGRDDTQIVNQRGQRPGAGDRVNRHRFGASADQSGKLDAAACAHAIPLKMTSAMLESNSVGDAWPDVLAPEAPTTAPPVHSCAQEFIAALKRVTGRSPPDSFVAVALAQQVLRQIAERGLRQCGERQRPRHVDRGKPEPRGQ